MIIPWTDDRCIFCTLRPEQRRQRCSKTAEFSEEHLIPEAIRGKLVCLFLCKQCNDKLGQLEARLKSDARTRLAIENLKQVLPDLDGSMSNNQAYIVQDAGKGCSARY